MIPVVPVSLADPKRRPRHLHWVAANEIQHLAPERLDALRCALVRIEGSDRIGIYHKDSLLSVRLLPRAFGARVQGAEVSPEDFVEILTDHLSQLRSWKAALFPFVANSAFRWCHGESDGLPGIVIDDYQQFVVVQSGNAPGDFLVPHVAKALAGLDGRPLLERSSGQVRAMEGLPERTRWLRAPAGTLSSEAQPPERSPSGSTLPLGPVAFAGLQMSFDPLRAQKTGLFLDQRMNLDTLASLLPGLRASSILDVCCYAGAWSAAAARSGLTNFTLVDADARALAMAEQNIRANATRNEVSIEARHGDLFEALAKEKQSGRTWDVVVADPPAFAKSRKHIPEATQAYARLIRQAARLVSPGGLLVVCSCSRNMEASTFEELAFRQLHEGDWVLARRGQQSPDHTVAVEGSEYLKCLFFLKRGYL